MAQVIQCPTCAKKFKLPDRPPATFTCTGCATVMDLSAFRTAGAAAPAAEPAAAASAGATAGAGARTGSSTRSARTGGAGGGGGGSTRTSSARRRAREEDGGDGGRDGLAPPKDGSKVLILGSIAGVVVIGAVAMLLMNKKDKPAPAPDPSAGMATAAATPPPPAGTTPAPAGAGMTTSPTPAPTDAGTDTAAPAGGDKPAPAPSSPRGPAVVKEVGHHPDATEDEKKNIDHLIDVAIFQNAGRDSREAEQQLVAIGIKAAPRLINVFNTVKLQEGFENRLGKMKAGIADRALRSIDGYIDRTSRGKATLVTAASDPKFVETIAKRWNNWWDSGAYKEPKKPWDERTEGNRGEKADPTDNPGTTDGK